MWHAAKWRETAHRVRELAKRLHEDDESLQVLLTLADDCDAQAEDLERAGKKKVEADVLTKYEATSTAHHHHHRRRRSTHR
jgi:hypothetical protein